MNVTSYKPVKVDGVPQLRYQCPACDKAQVTPLVNAGKPRTCDQCLAESVLPSIQAIKEKFPQVVPAPPPPKATIEQILAPKKVDYGADDPPSPFQTVEDKLSRLIKEAELTNARLKITNQFLFFIAVPFVIAFVTAAFWLAIIVVAMAVGVSGQ